MDGRIMTPPATRSIPSPGVHDSSGQPGLSIYRYEKAANGGPRAGVRGQLQTVSGGEVSNAASCAAYARGSSALIRARKRGRRVASPGTD